MHHFIFYTNACINSLSLSVLTLYMYVQYLHRGIESALVSAENDPALVGELITGRQERVSDRSISLEILAYF